MIKLLWVQQYLVTHQSRKTCKRLPSFLIGADISYNVLIKEPVKAKFMATFTWLIPQVPSERVANTNINCMYISLPLFCTRLQGETSYTSYPFFGGISYSLFFTAAHFHLGGRKHFSFKSPPQGNVFFMLFFQRNSSPLLNISCSRSFFVKYVIVHIKI